MFYYQIIIITEC